MNELINKQTNKHFYYCNFFHNLWLSRVLERNHLVIIAFKALFHRKPQLIAYKIITPILSPSNPIARYQFYYTSPDRPQKHRIEHRHPRSHQKLQERTHRRESLPLLVSRVKMALDFHLLVHIHSASITQPLHT